MYARREICPKGVCSGGLQQKVAKSREDEVDGMREMMEWSLEWLLLCRWRKRTTTSQEGNVEWVVDGRKERLKLWWGVQVFIFPSPALSGLPAGT